MFYDLREIQNNFLTLKPKEKKKGRPSKINFIYRERSLLLSKNTRHNKTLELENII